MKKNQKDKIAQVTKLLEKQKIRSVKKLDSYKLSICHPFSNITGTNLTPITG